MSKLPMFMTLVEQGRQAVSKVLGRDVELMDDIESEIDEAKLGGIDWKTYKTRKN